MAELIFLGTSNAFGHDGRHTACLLLSGSHNILVDAGYSVLSAVRANFQPFPKIDAILISHIHPDHFMGLPQMVLEDYYVIKRDYSIPVFGPKGLAQKVLDLVNIMYSDELAAHVNVLFKFHESNPGEKFEIPGGSVETLEAAHGGNARMQIINFEGKTIGYSGDTSFLEHSINRLLDCDLTILESSSFDHPIPDHITAKHLVDLSFPADKIIYLTHLGEGVRRNQGEIKPPLYIADDGMRITL